MKTYYRVLLVLGLSIYSFTTSAQNQSFSLSDLIGKEWNMLGLTDKTSTANYEGGLLVNTLKDMSGSEYIFKFEFYLSDTIVHVFDSTKVGEIAKGNYIITRVLKDFISNPDQPQPVSSFQIVELTSTNLIIRNATQSHVLEYQTK